MLTAEEYMQIAIDISKTAKYPYGAIVVKDGEIIGRSDSKKVKLKGVIPTQNLLPFKTPLKTTISMANWGATMYVSTEPCPMCMGALLYQEFDKLYYGAKLEDSNKYYCPEVLISCEAIAKATKNRKLEIHNIMREEAVKVLKSRKNQ